MRKNIKNIVYILMVTGILSQAGCLQNSGTTPSCYSDNLAEKDTVLTRTLHKPQFKGGNDSLVNFLSANINFETLISDFFQKTSGIYSDKATIKFIVSKHGNLSDLSVTLAKKKLFEEEIVRVIKKSSCNWVAGKTKQFVNAWLQFDIYFLVEKSNNKVKTTMTFNEYVPAD